MYEGAVQNLIDELGRLPGVGPKSAQRIAFHILNADAADMARLANAISTVKTSVSFCEECGNVSETKLCTICRDERRDPSVLCVVEESKDVVAIERTRSFTGRYHVLGGAINPLAGVGPEQLRIRELVSRLADERIQEIILAMDPNLEVRRPQPTSRACSCRWVCVCRAWPRACRWAAIWSMQTKLPWVARWRVAASLARAPRRRILPPRILSA